MTTLDTVVEKKVRPMLDEAMKAYLGVRIDELSAEVSDRIMKSPMLDIVVDLSLPFKKAKLAFRRHYLLRLVQLHYGNLAQVARLSGIDRRSVHRLIKDLGVQPDRFRKEMHRQEFYLQSQVKSIILESTEQFKESLAPQKYRAFYEHAPVLSKSIAKELPIELPTLDQAEQQWEKRYLEQAMAKFGPSPVAVAKRIGLRYETLHRKLVKHGLS